MPSITAIGAGHLGLDIDLSRRAINDQGKTPFGAFNVLDGNVIGTGTSSVIEPGNPSAHAEAMALRTAAR